MPIYTWKIPKVSSASLQTPVREYYSFPNSIINYGGLELWYRSRSDRARRPSAEPRSYIVLAQAGHSGEANRKPITRPRGMSRKEPPINQRKVVLKLSRDNSPRGRITRPTRNTTIQTIGAMQPPTNAPSKAVPARLRPVAWTGFPTNPHSTLEQINGIPICRGYQETVSKPEPGVSTGSPYYMLALILTLSRRDRGHLR